MDETIAMQEEMVRERDEEVVQQTSAAQELKSNLDDIMEVIAIDGGKNAALNDKCNQLTLDKQNLIEENDEKSRQLFETRESLSNKVTKLLD